MFQQQQYVINRLSKEERLFLNFSKKRAEKPLVVEAIVIEYAIQCSLPLCIFSNQTIDSCQKKAQTIFVVPTLFGRQRIFIKFSYTGLQESGLRISLGDRQKLKDLVHETIRNRKVDI